ncbi:thioredoxin family protein [Leptolyngbya sp. 'hensonii']|uniref:thylakoid membrane photosystem I accumulation factor n=1 Tax=Leptolyngbya sp. 'hensonii' TaxID=1922337 RepID=UPI0009500423|nr:thylakoid membrane photosystem I accumulation factor [Leptolyngbya sp. 'hensonii']OLP20234.1 thioredoxin family protein [Leptolyngbya sp. 'hensonii']
MSLSWWKPLFRLTLILVLLLTSLVAGVLPAQAGLHDDHFDGNIFALYAGNGSLVPPRISLAESLKRQKPALLMFYTEDSRDCKEYSGVISQLQAYYGRAANFIPVSSDSLLPDVKYSPQDPGFYYKGRVPQTVLIDQAGQVVLDEKGKIPFERVDDVFRQVFDLLPRSESVELRRRIVNEINTELVQQ